MSNSKPQKVIVIVDDEWQSASITAVQRRLDEEGWRTVVVEPEPSWSLGEEFELAAMYAIQEDSPDGLRRRTGLLGRLEDGLGYSDVRRGREPKPEGDLSSEHTTSEGGRARAGQHAAAAHAGLNLDQHTQFHSGGNHNSHDDSNSDESWAFQVSGDKGSFN